MINEAISSILQQEAEAVRNIPITDGYEEAVTLIVKHVHELGGNLITSGMGKAGQIAMNIATTFCSTGKLFYQYGFYQFGYVCRRSFVEISEESFLG